jgi:hypothetical protein
MVKEISILNKIDKLESALLDNFEVVNCPLVHKFVPGMYIREIFMPQGAIVTSQIHKTTHPFFILKGKVSVFSENDGEQILEAPYSGITTPNTKRVIRVHADTVWVTCHPTDIQPRGDSEEAILEAVNSIGQQIIEPHVNEYVGGQIKNNLIMPNLLENEL